MIDTILGILRLFADNHLFDEGVALIGSWCFWIYQRKLDAKGMPLKTQDIDFLIPNPYRGKECSQFIDQLHAPLMKSLSSPYTTCPEIAAPVVYIALSDVLIALLTHPIRRPHQIMHNAFSTPTKSRTSAKTRMTSAVGARQRFLNVSTMGNHA